MFDDTIDFENIPDIEFEDAPVIEENNFADFLGLYLAAFVITFISASLLAIAFSIMPNITFNFLNICKCFAGIWGIMLARGALKNKVF